MAEQVAARQSNPSRPRDIALCALCVALLVVSCFFTVPIGPVPFTMQTAVVILIALLLTPKQAALTTGAYLVMGAIGLPVFSGMTGGIVRASTGFLLSYFIGTVIASAIRLQLEKRGVKQIACDIVTAALIIVISDTLGWLWMMFFTQSDPLSAFLIADAPFIAIDCCKAVVSILVAIAVRKALLAA